MLTATFGPATDWRGRTINFDGSSFVVQGFGPVSAADVLSCGRQGHLIWASTEMAGLVQTMAESLDTVRPVACHVNPGTGQDDWATSDRI
jgi:hypothetical protein